jgi:DNA-binding GntR family transcriptional regulator
MNTDLEPALTLEPALNLKKAVRGPSHRKILTEELIANLRDTICSGQLRAGSRVTVGELRRRFGVSRTPLRKALRMLASEGLVIMLPGRSAVIAPPGRQRSDELIPILGALEVLAGELAWHRIDDRGVKHLRRLHQRCVDCFTGKDVSAYIDTDTAMREVIFEFASNRKLIDVYRLLQAQLRLPVTSVIALPEWSNALQAQDRVLRALEKKNAYMGGLVSRSYMRRRAAILQALVATDVSGQRIRRAGR